MFGNLGFGEMLVILIVGLVVIGPKKLPELARSLGKGLSEFRRAALDLKTSLSVELEEDERRTRLAPAPSPRTPAPPRSENPASVESSTTKASTAESEPSLPTASLAGPPPEALARGGLVQTASETKETTP